MCPEEAHGVLQKLSRTPLCIAPARLLPTAAGHLQRLQCRCAAAFDFEASTNRGSRCQLLPPCARDSNCARWWPMLADVWCWPRGADALMPIIALKRWRSANTLPGSSSRSLC